MIGNVERVDERLTSVENLNEVARVSQPEVTFSVSANMHCVHNRRGASEDPKWLSIGAAALALGVSRLHVRVLVRDGVLASISTGEQQKVFIKDVLEMREVSMKVKRQFARDAADLDGLRKIALQQSA